jgi:hypothetical protein
MSKEQENLRQEFIDETKAKLWAQDINKDAGFSDKYVEWLEAKQLILSGVSKSFYCLDAGIKGSEHLCKKQCDSCNRFQQ